MKKIYIPLLLSILTMTSAMARQKEYKGSMRVTPLQLEQRGDSLLIGIDFDISGVNVDSRRSISLIPVLAAPGREKKLPEVMVKGRANYLTSKRELALMGKAEYRLYNQNPPYAIIKGYKEDGQKRIRYRKTILFEPWMKEARLDIREDLCGCGNAPRTLAVSQLVNAVTLEKIVEPYVVTPYLAYVQPKAEAVKKREMVSEAFLDFAVSKTDIRPDYMNNPRELKKITDMMAELRSDPAVTVRSIWVEGYASPEGTLAGNQKLSEGRATALVDYLLPRFDYPRSLYRVRFGGENWTGLLAMVEASSMEYRDEVLHILRTVPAEINYRTGTSRKKSLMMLRGGDPYRYMLREYFPSLRKAICKIDYEVKGFDVTEATKVFRTRPQNLSLNEMYLVANTYTPGSQEFADVFETAARMFPEDQTANLNAAAAALSRKDMPSAERYLAKVKVPSPQYDNAMGVLAMLRGEYPKAEGYFVRAQAEGLPAATKNLAELDRKIENINIIESQTNKSNN